MSSQDSQSKQTAIVTGGSRGVGRSIVLRLAERGIHTIFTYRSNKTEAEKVAAAATRGGVTAVALRCDQADVQQISALVSQIPEQLRRLGQEKFDYLINNAGTALQASIEQTTPNQVDEMYNVHFKGPFLLTQGLLPLLKDGGRIVNVSSAVTRLTFPGIAAYAAMKGAVEVLTRYMAKELGSRRIAVNAVAPGAVETDFGGGTVRDNEQVKRFVAEMTSLGRVGLPDDIGGMVASLLSPDNAWINGQTIEVSGGQGL